MFCGAAIHCTPTPPPGRTSVSVELGYADSTLPAPRNAVVIHRFANRQRASACAATVHLSRYLPTV